MSTIDKMIRTSTMNDTYIDSLEKERDRYKEALISISECDLDGTCDTGWSCSVTAEMALNRQSNKTEAE